MRNLILFLILGVFFVSCDALKSTGDFGAVKKAFTTNDWLLQDENGTVVSYNGQNVSMVFSQESDGFKASGFAGCNRFFSTVDLQPGHIKFTQPSATLMACPDMAGEEAFLDLITLVNAYEVSGNELKLFQDKILLLRFRAK